MEIGEEEQIYTIEPMPDPIPHENKPTPEVDPVDDPSEPERTPAYVLTTKTG